jgi:hypothetical protein
MTPTSDRSPPTLLAGAIKQRLILLSLGSMHKLENMPQNKDQGLSEKVLSIAHQAEERSRRLTTKGLGRDEDITWKHERSGSRWGLTVAVVLVVLGLALLLWGGHKML